MQWLYLDLETYSGTPITYGAHKYAEDCEILLFAYAVDDEPVDVVDLSCRDSRIVRRTDIPQTLCRALEEVAAGTRKIVAHNGMNFDTVVLDRLMPDFSSASAHPAFKPENIVDSMVLAYESALPGALGDLCTIFRFPQDKAKDKDGKRLIQIFCAPLPKNYKVRRWTKKEKPDEWARFVKYCAKDVGSMRDVFKRLPKWNLTRWERRIQVLDADINRRGIAIDKALAEGALTTWEAAKVDLSKRTADATNGSVMSSTQRDALLQYINDEYHVNLDSLTKSEVEKRINDENCPDQVKDLLTLRLMSTKNSAAKYQKVLNWLCTDNRLRGTLQFRGASRTGRWSGRGPQFQNLARPSMKQPEIDSAIEAVKGGCVGLMYDDVGQVLANCLRGLIVAPKGKKLVVADYSNIEGRVLAWLAGEPWKIKAFQDYDAGRGEDIYKMTYGKTFGINPKDVTKAQRQMGKVLELALGYGGGAGAFASFARLYGVDLHTLVDEVRKAAKPSIWEKAVDSYETFFKPRGMTEGLDRDVFIACDTVKRAWRIANPHIERFWKLMDNAITTVLTSPEPGLAGRYIRADRKGSYLRLRLPSGRYISYPNARLDDEGGFSYEGMLQFTRKWSRIRSYGSKAVENVTQAVACDVLAEGLLRMDAAGYKTVLTIHDEAITEAPDSPSFSYEQMAALMATVPDWAPGLPLSVDGYEGHRYMKK